MGIAGRSGGASRESLTATASWGPGTSAEAAVVASVRVSRTKRVSVLVGDEFPVVRRGVVAAARRRWDLEPAGEAEDGHEALRLIRSLAPDVALLDRRLPILDGLQVATTVATEALATRILIFSSEPDGGAVQRAIAAGAVGFITKREPIEGICEAIRRVAAGESYLSGEAREALWNHLRRGEPAIRSPLTARELEILTLSAHGASNAMIGIQLHLSLSTVKNHQRLLYEKLGVSTAAAAVYRAMREGILQ